MNRHGSTILFGALLLGGCRHADPEATARPSERGAPDRDAPPESPRPSWWQGATFYEIFVRSFADSDGDGVGDFRGLTARLDALSDGDPATTDDLGIEAIWLMPIHPSPSYHGYDVTDDRAIHPDYGTLDDFDAFIEAAHARGIRVIIDFVLNHASARHPWFLESRRGQMDPRRDFFVWRPNPDPRFVRPWDGSTQLWHDGGSGYYYGIFWSGMPDWNLANAEVERHMVESMRFWLQRGVDGFRVDAVRYLVEDEDGTVADTAATHALSRRIRAELSRTHPEAVLVAEAWTSAENVAPYYGDGDEYHLAFGFDVAGALVEAAKDGLRASVSQAVSTLRDVYPSLEFVAPFLTNHDMPRVMRQLGDAEAGNRPAAATLFALPGSPFVYYGEEIGMRGGPTAADEDKRTPMRWDDSGPGFGFTTAATPWRVSQERDGVSVAAQRSDDTSLWRLYQRLIAYRRDEPALRYGGLEPVRVEGGGRGTTGFLRTGESDSILYVVNFHEERTGPFAVKGVGGRVAKVGLSEGLEAPPAVGADGLEFAGLDGRGFAFVVLSEERR